ncbi:pentapeptide repeat-containing protein [Clostridium botulinum]|uniref:pentapeptide repeat-containing protein n=1 Tax=Clostridium botulinum TaxID=1491 RepID=UPI003DA49F24
MNNNCIGYGEKEGKCKNKAVTNKNPTYCRNCAGQAFEDHIAKLFEVQGYEVLKNLKLKGTQNDFYAKLTYGIAKIGILVECKFKFDYQHTVDSKDVRKFFGSLEVFNKNQSVYGRAEKAFLVTNSKFAPEEIEVAKELNIELYTEFELIKNLMNFEPYLKRIKNDYLNSNLNNHFIELKTNLGDDLNDEINYLIYEAEEEAIVILGDYGCGKTSFCMRLAFELADKILKGQDAPIPILIQLRDYVKAFDMEELITNMLVNKCKIPNGNFNTFMELLQYGYLVLIFDGFDEVARRVDYSIKYKVFNEICKFANNKSMIIVTCRRNFFQQREEFENIFKSSPLHFEPNIKNVMFYEVEVGDLSQEQIEEYIDSYKDDLNKEGISVKDLFNVIQNTHDLMDLAKRPVLLNIIKETVPKLKNSMDGNSVNASTLYRKYTSFWLDREDSKGKTLIKSSEKMLFTKELAKDMFNKNELTINYKELPTKIKKFFNITTSDDIDHFSHDIQSCSFLNVDNEGNYKFIHKSFMEYFVAWQILYELQSIDLNNSTIINEINSILGSEVITLEIGMFINDLIISEEFKRENFLFLDKFINKKDISKIAEKNILSILSKSQSDLIKFIGEFRDFDGVDLSCSIIENHIFENKNFDGVVLVNTKLRNVKFIECSFKNVVFRKSVIENVDFIGSCMYNNDLSMSTITNCSLSASDLSFSNFKNTIFKNTNFDYTDLTEVKINSLTCFISCENLDTSSGIPYEIDKLIK